MNGGIRRDVSLQSLNTLATPSRAEYFARLESPADLPSLLDRARTGAWPVRVLAGGSNVVLGEKLPGLTIQQACRGVRELARDERSVSLAVAAGENWHAFVEWCLHRGYYGLENLALIPGSVGAAPIQNIGAYGVEVGGSVESVRCRYLAGGQALDLQRADCEFSYRDSLFKRALRDRVIVEEVRLKLSKVEAPVTDYPGLRRWLGDNGITRPGARQVFEAVVAMRRSRLPDPDRIPNTGSFFKNPRVDRATLHRLLADYPDLPHYPAANGSQYRLAAAWLIETCGFKRGREGPVRVHPDHALVIVNPEQRPAFEIRAFAEKIATAVRERFGLSLEQEPCNYG